MLTKIYKKFQAKTLAVEISQTYIHNIALLLTNKMCLTP